MTIGETFEDKVKAGLQHFRFQLQKEKLDAEAEWWRSQPEENRKRYEGEVVAIHHQEVVDHDRDEELLEKRIRAKYGKTAVYLTPAAGRREYRIVSTRFSQTQ